VNSIIQGMLIDLVGTMLDMLRLVVYLGTGADLVKNAIILVNESIQKRNLCQGCGLLLTIHGKIKYCSCSCRVVNVVFLR